MSYTTFRLDPTVVDDAILSPDLDDNIEDVEDPPDLPKDVRISRTSSLDRCKRQQAGRLQSEKHK